MNNPNSRLMIFLLALLLMMVLLLGYLHSAEARETFNTHALELDSSGQPVVDLSAFAEADGQMPGTYRVTVYVNGEQQGDAQDIAFVSGANKKLTAQLTPAMLKDWGVNIAAFPTLAALPPETPWKIPAAISRWLPANCVSANCSCISVFRRRR